jgi:hypothetical protein
VAREILSKYLAAERPKAAVGDPLFVVRFKTRGGRIDERRSPAMPSFPPA